MPDNTRDLKRCLTYTTKIDPRVHGLEYDSINRIAAIFLDENDGSATLLYKGDGDDHDWRPVLGDSGGGGSGSPGLSAYQVAVANGFVGTQAAWLASLVGPKGNTGNAGAQGPIGATGSQGPIGPQGNAGTNGAPGAAGAQGPQGEPGIDGNDGAPGDDGATGPQGEPGPPGADGEDGAQGPQGIQGVPGNDGAQGIQGPPGNDGAPGAPGVDGEDGEQGIQGIQGPPGTDGTNGTNGTNGISAARLWHGKIAAAYGDGDPADLLRHMQRAGNIAPTPTNIAITVARLSFFRLAADLVVNKLRYYGVGSTANVYRVALYRYSDLARLTAELPLTTAANTWGSVGSALNLTLTKDVLYFLACSVNATGTTAGIAAMGGTIAATTGQIATAPSALPGNLDADAGFVNGYQAQMTVVAGALPSPAIGANVVAQGAWVGGMPALFLDNNNA